MLALKVSIIESTFISNYNYLPFSANLNEDVAL